MAANGQFVIRLTILAFEQLIGGIPKNSRKYPSWLGCNFSKALNSNRGLVKRRRHGRAREPMCC